MLEHNLRALAHANPALAARISAARGGSSCYTFIPSRSGPLVPAWRGADQSGAARALHSLVDPKREADRLLGAYKEEGFFVFLGLGAGFAPAAALERPGIERVLIIEYDISGVAELLAAADYRALLGDRRVLLLVDAPAALVERKVLEEYNPVMLGGIRILPLRSRTACDPARFNAAFDAVQSAVARVGSDYSAQAQFGMRWFSNIIRNLPRVECGDSSAPLPAAGHVSITAAGPSLDAQIHRLVETRDATFLMATDTSLPALMQAGLTPDAVVSIDCQHISYMHFMQGLPCPLYLDLASPPLVASRSPAPRFFSSGHPLTRYVSSMWRPLPMLDTSGGNVTYAAVSLADSLGAEVVALYGADFAYPLGRTYARGTYINPWFERRQTRLAPYESLASAFLYRSGGLKRVYRNEAWYYETPLLAMYRARLEEKAETMHAALEPAAGLGAPIEIRRGPRRPAPVPLFEPEGAGHVAISAEAFLAGYRRCIDALPPLGCGGGITGLDPESRIVFATLLPLAAAFKRRNPLLKAPELFEKSRQWSIGAIDRVRPLSPAPQAPWGA